MLVGLMGYYAATFLSPIASKWFATGSGHRVGPRWIYIELQSKGKCAVRAAMLSVVKPKIEIASNRVNRGINLFSNRTASLTPRQQVSQSVSIYLVQQTINWPAALGLSS